MSLNKTRIGWKETVDLPDWGIENILAKADTGARRSALDVRRLHELPNGWVEFEIVLDRKRPELTRTVRCPVAHVTHVRSSNGQQHERFFVTTRVCIGKVEKEIELSLVNRREMVCRMLLGRKALEGDFLVDASASHLTRVRHRVRATTPSISPPKSK